MEEKSIYTVVENIAEIVKGFEDRLIKNEQLLLRSFSYLYARIDEVSQVSDIDKLREDINNFQTSYLTQLTTLSKEIKNNKKYIENLESNILINASTISKQNKRKRKRPWYWFLIKKREYKKLLEQKRILEGEIEKRREEERIRKEQEENIRKQQLEAKRKEEEKNRLEKRRKAQKEMSSILSKIKK